MTFPLFVLPIRFGSLSSCVIGNPLGKETEYQSSVMELRDKNQGYDAEARS